MRTSPFVGAGPHLSPGCGKILRERGRERGNGAILFHPPEEIPEEMKRNIRPMKAKKFGKKYGNSSGLEEEALQQEFAWEGGTYELDAEIVRGI